MCIKISPVLRIKRYWFDICSGKGPFKYYDIKEVGGWGGQMMMFDDKVGVAKWWRDQKTYKKKTLAMCAEKKVGIFSKKLFFMQ